MPDESIDKRLTDCEQFQSALATDILDHREDIAELRADLRKTLEVLEYFFTREQAAFRDQKLDETKKQLVGDLIKKLRGQESG
jgi:hypothetical protein